MEQIQNEADLQKGFQYVEEYGCNIFIDNGFPLPPGMKHTVKKVKEFEVYDDDVFVVGYPKSGTNWLQIAIAKMREDWGTCKITEKGRVPVLELPGRAALEGIEKCIEASSPRLIKTHLPLQYFPQQRAEKKCKIVYIARNPKDVCVSFYNMNKAFDPIKFTSTFDEYVLNFADGKVFYGSHADHVVDWNKLKVDDNVLHLSYEEMKIDTQSVLKKVSSFIGQPKTDDEIKELTDSISFNKMKKTSRDMYNVGVLNEKVSPFLRKSVVGDWKTHFTVAQSEVFDEKLGKKLNESGIKMMYE